MELLSALSICGLPSGYYIRKDNLEWKTFPLSNSAIKDQSKYASKRFHWVNYFKNLRTQSVLWNRLHGLLEASSVSMTVDRVIDQPRKYSTLFLPTNEMYPCSVAEKRANVWVGGRNGCRFRGCLRFPPAFKKNWTLTIANISVDHR